MTHFGYTLMTEQSGPKPLVRYASGAERAGFDFEVMSDHYSPWLASQGHAPYAWSVLGAIAQTTERVELMTYVTCPTVRYHPAVVAQKAATVQLLADGRFTLGLGSGERLNEHVVGEGWPGADVRQQMLVEAIEIIRGLHGGEVVDFHGDYFEVDAGRLWDLPEQPVELAVAVGGEHAIRRFAPLADHLVAVEPNADFIAQWNDIEGAAPIPKSGRAIGQIPVCWAPDEQTARTRAREQFRWFAGGWAVNAELPTAGSFKAATQFVTEDDVASSIPCGPDLDAIAEVVRPYVDAGFTDVALVQIGDDGQDDFLAEAAEPLLRKLRAL
ncbi:TIGR03557 family F420-dependent LLM class oxidoreductase [Flexivirga meconopsidis]|uniref:TIGR03557 family F420-dependent LLM class oxidoreductase n=1 Tax=Flexivirga meconopsidis TaxID=2977121 RepID=UPI00223F0238|nr:TIGR03557 family F420-dependent LLM class oxidoreductase [Flexivirga meconopsidis]